MRKFLISEAIPQEASPTKTIPYASCQARTRGRNLFLYMQEKVMRISQDENSGKYTSVVDRDADYVLRLTHVAISVLAITESLSAISNRSLLLYYHSCCEGGQA